MKLIKDELDYLKKQMEIGDIMSISYVQNGMTWISSGEIIGINANEFVLKETTLDKGPIEHHILFDTVIRYEWLYETNDMPEKLESELITDENSLDFKVFENLVVRAIKFTRETLIDIMKKYPDRVKAHESREEGCVLWFVASNGNVLHLDEGNYIFEFVDGYVTALSKETMQHLFTGGDLNETNN